MKLLTVQSGDTLIEVLLATTILSLVIVTAVSVSLTAFQTGQRAKRRTEAANLLQEQAEGLRNFRDASDWAGSPQSFSGPSSIYRPLYEPGFHVETSSAKWLPHAGHDRSHEPFDLVITGVPDSAVGVGNKWMFTFEASWPSTNGVTDNIKFSTYLTNFDRIRPRDCSGSLNQPATDTSLVPTC